MLELDEFSWRIFRMLTESGFYAEKRERRCLNYAFMAMMEERPDRGQQKDPFRHFETLGRRLRISFCKVVQ